MPQDREEQARNRFELQAQTQKLERLMDVAPAAVFIALDPEGRQVAGNATAYRLLGLPPGTNLSLQASNTRILGFRALHDGREVTEENDPLMVAMRTRQEVAGYEVELIFADRVETWIGKAAHLENSEGEVTGGRRCLPRHHPAQEGGSAALENGGAEPV